MRVVLINFERKSALHEREQASTKGHADATVIKANQRESRRDQIYDQQESRRDQIYKSDSQIYSKRVRLRSRKVELQVRLAILQRR
jgi:vacuolar-type H+-ATPase subunit E/Vma4